MTQWTVGLQTPLSMWFPRVRILEWVAISFSREIYHSEASSLCVLCLAGESFPTEPPGNWKVLLFSQSSESQMPHSIQLSHSLVSFNLGQFSLSLFVFDYLGAFKGTGQLFQLAFLNFSSSDFLLVRLIYIFIKSTAKVQFCPSQYIVSGGTCCWHVFLLMMFISITESGRYWVFLP